MQSTDDHGFTVTVCTPNVINPPEGAIVASDIDCFERQKTYTCYSEAPACNTDPACRESPGSRLCLEYDAAGQCVDWNITYQCSRGTAQCVRFADQNNCLTLNTFGFENQAALPPDEESQKNAMAGTGILQEMQTDSNEPADQTGAPSLFTGSHMQCKKEDYMLKNCCSTSLQDQGFLLTACSKSEVKLAGAKRANTATYIGDGCCQKAPLIGCIKRARNYCVFDSILAKIIQVEGRKQLAELATGPNFTTQARDLDLDYYESQEGAGGRWAGPVELNGNQFWHWQWSRQCKPENRGALTYDQMIQCPMASGEMRWAVCSGGTSTNGTIRDDQPHEDDASPRGRGVNAASTNTKCTIPTFTPPKLVTSEVNISAHMSQNDNGETFALTRYLVLKPRSPQACETDRDSDNPKCRYTASGLTSGAGIITSKLNWTLFVEDAGWEKWTTLGFQWLFAGRSVPVAQSPKFGTNIPQTVEIRYAPTENGVDPTGPIETLTLPVNISPATPYLIPGTGITIFGGCQGPYYLCKYQVFAPAQITARPFGNPGCGGGDPANNFPDCGGLTMAEFSHLDMSRIDLSEWLESLQPKQPDPAQVQTQVLRDSPLLQTPVQP
ncbi:conjugal transfer protein TraN [Sinimarinibacterium sp. NLF-5-8]|uniref:conjugal transfer protein TraN n=1 Tax=Sinimarinibacterium sp. NLF-5-8 TaxID=2698684 RepID=UPI00137C07FE|nr:conjugal transfer protein TraN [Sinimarinibacterium sp. NLF-5-8]QHS08992.1 conjugal transfer protein TraN [Sinimarinibacterium sp. NLF-5-8]